MRKLLLLPILALALAGCGSSSITGKITTAGTTISIVLTGDSSAIANAKASALSDKTTGGEISDGDTHVGNKICEFDTSNDKDHKTIHVTVYSSKADPSLNAMCDSIKSTALY